MYLKVQMLPCNAKHYMLVRTFTLKKENAINVSDALVTRKVSFKKLTNLTPFHLNREITYTCYLVHVSLSM